MRQEAVAVRKTGARETVLFALFTALTAAGAFIRVPVFTEGGGPGYIFQPTFGYLIGFIAGAWLTGRIREGARGLPSVKRLLAADFAGLLVVYLFGMVYVYALNNFVLGTPIGIWPVVLYCFILAVPGDICLCVLAAMLALCVLAAMLARRLFRTEGIID